MVRNRGLAPKTSRPSDQQQREEAEAHAMPRTTRQCVCEEVSDAR